MAEFISFVKNQYDYVFFVIITSVIFIYSHKVLATKYKAKLLTSVFVVFYLILMISGFFWVNWQEKLVITNQKNKLLGFAPTYALELEKLGHANLNFETSKSNPLYLELIEREISWQRINPAIADIYTMKKDKDGKIALLVDAETDYDNNGKFEGEREQRTNIGEIYDKAQSELNMAFSGQSVFLDSPYEDRWGKWISAFVPMYSDNGTVDAVLGVDYPAENFIYEIRFIRRTYIFYLFCVLLIVGILGGAYQIARAELIARELAEKTLEKIRLSQARSAKLTALGEMASGIAHEINNPLAIIVGKASLLRSKINSSEITKAAVLNDLEKIITTSNRISKIIGGLRAFARNAEKDPMIETRVNQIIEDTLELCKERFYKNSVTLNIDISSSENIVLNCRGTQISQILLNLLNNAFDATNPLEHKWVKLETVVSDNHISIQVTDSGFGIPPEVTEKMMQPFFTTKEIGQGTGLGLSISKGLAEEHNGQLIYAPDYPHTRFVLELPLA